MNTVGLHPQYKPRDPSSRWVGIGLVIVLHILLGYGIITGTARSAFEMVKKPLQAVLVEEVIIPPPPPPPPPKPIVKPPEAPKVDAPPPPFVPPPDVAPPTTSTAPTIQSAPTPPAAPAVIAPPPAPVASTGPRRAALGIACPQQVKPEWPRKAVQEHIQGDVVAQILVRNDTVVEVTILSGQRVFHQAVRAAIMQYKCLSGPGEVLTEQTFTFKLSDE